MTLHVRTAQFRYSGDDRFDITRKSGCDDGKVFAPTWNILRDFLMAREEAEILLREGFSLGGNPAYAMESERITKDAWNKYVPLYVAEMRASHGAQPGAEFWELLSTDEQLRVIDAIDRGVRYNPGAWKRLLGRDRVVLVCYCSEREMCHRTLLAQILKKLGAVYHGEVR